MKKLIVIIAVVLFTTTGLFAQTIPFEKFDKSRIDVGTLYVYEYSKNKEDFKPIAKYYLYIKTLNDIEVMFVTNKNTIARGIYKNKLNWDYMMLERNEWQSWSDKNKMVNNTIFKSKTSINFLKKELKYNSINKVKDGFKKISFVSKFESAPTYLYGFTSFMPLWFALRFYPLGKEKTTVNTLTNNYNVDTDIKYEGKEEVEVPYGKVLCYKFELVPQLSFFIKLLHSPKKAFIWLTSEDSTRYMVKYTNNNEQSTFTQSMEYRLAERKKMTPKEWEQFKEKYRAKRLSIKN